ncbi:hypothetical protein EBR96_02680, partial [bacterium]|nr:hypothetical protein [bacterium]
MNKLKHWVLLFLFCALLLTPEGANGDWAAGNTPTKITIQATLSTQAGGVIKGPQTVKLQVYNGTTPIGIQLTQRNVNFSSGVFSMTVDISALVPNQNDFLSCSDPQLEIEVQNAKGKIPLYSTPFAVQSRIAEVARSVDAGSVSGVFVSANILNDLIVNRTGLVVKSAEGKVGIGTANPTEKLDVAGVVNAKGFKVNGVDLESSFSWVANKSQLYYDQGFVGIGTSNPTYMLDVAGTINAREYYIGGVSLSAVLKRDLAWQVGRGNDIYFDDGTTAGGGNVGIGTTDPQEKLDVVGAIRIGEASAGARAGMIQYLTDTSTGKGDFYGYNGTEWLSLTGIQGSGTSGNIGFWKDTRRLGSVPDLFWNGSLGIGTNAPNARLTVRSSSLSSPAFHVLSPANDSLFYVGPTGVGIGTSLPQQKLDVKGIVNAQGYRVNGKPLEFALSSDSFWLLENEGRIFYDKGFVGIGTTQPSNMLELASVSGNPAITFDIAGQRLFTMGIGADNPDAFIIGKGADLSVPVFTFKDQNIGVGLSTPKANLHVSGNSGVIISGQFASGEVLTETGRGAKFIWFPSKAAVRAGYVLRDEWDNDKLGDYSVALGYSGLATATGSAVIGGFRNRATGLYSAAVGGLSNIAAGDYSFAIGHEAVALHRGSFVWADYTPTSDTSSFISSAPNQFIIRANGGVGIGTTDTLGNGLKVVNPRSKEYILSATGLNESPLFVVSTSGNVGLGTTDPGTSKMAIMGGSLGIGTSRPRAVVTITQPISATRDLLFIAAETSPTAALLVTASGNVGIGVRDGSVFGAGDVNALFVAGGIKATEFRVVDPSDPNQTITIQPNPGSPWADPEKNGGNTFRSQGLVGIGTPSPNNLLELSNRNASGDIPVLAFDIDGVDRFSMRVVTPNNDPNQYMFGIVPTGGSTGIPSVVISSSSVGIGIGNNVPSASLHVSGNSIFIGKLAVGTTNITSTYRMNVGGALNVDDLYIGGIKFVNKDTPWITSAPNIYYNLGNVGIGTSTPAQKLDVVGTIRTNTFIVTDPLSIQGSLFAADLYLKDTPASIPPRYGRLFVDNAALKFTNPSGNTKVISSPLQKGVGRNGKLAYFIDDSTIGQSDVIWDADVPQLKVSGNFSVVRQITDGGVQVGTSVSMGGLNAMTVSANLSHDGNLLSSIRSFSGQNIDLSIDKNWGHLLNPVDIKGLNIKMQTASGFSVLNYASVVGLGVDVSSVNVDAAEGGKKYAAVFMGGNVGIGTTRPQSELEVVGTVSANYFNLTGGLNVPELVVNGGRADSGTFVVRSVINGSQVLPRVGVGITNPETRSVEMTVSGAIQANTVAVLNGLSATTLNINNGSFYIDSTGNVGIGTTRPNGQIEIVKKVDSAQLSNVVSQKVNLSIDGGAPQRVF